MISSLYSAGVTFGPKHCLALNFYNHACVHACVRVYERTHGRGSLGRTAFRMSRTANIDQQKLVNLVTTTFLARTHARTQDAPSVTFMSITAHPPPNPPKKSHLNSPNMGEHIENPNSFPHSIFTTKGWEEE